MKSGKDPFEPSAQWHDGHKTGSVEAFAWAYELALAHDEGSINRRLAEKIFREGMARYGQAFEAEVERRRIGE